MSSDKQSKILIIIAAIWELSLLSLATVELIQYQYPEIDHGLKGWMAIIVPLCLPVLFFLIGNRILRTTCIKRRIFFVASIIVFVISLFYLNIEWMAFSYPFVSHTSDYVEFYEKSFDSCGDDESDAVLRGIIPDFLPDSFPDIDFEYKNKFADGSILYLRIGGDDENYAKVLNTLKKRRKRSISNDGNTVIDIKPTQILKYYAFAVIDEKDKSITFYMSFSQPSFNVKNVEEKVAEYIELFERQRQGDGSDTIINDLYSFDSDKKYIICNRYEENPCILEFDYSSDCPVIADNSREIILEPYKEIALFCLTDQGIPLYVANEENGSSLIINNKKYSLKNCPSDILPYMDSAILVYDDEETCSSYICKANPANGEEETIISDLAFERANDYLRTCSSQIVYKSSTSKENEWNLYNGLTDETTSFVCRGACVGFTDASTLVFCEAIDSPFKNKIKFTRYDLNTNETEQLCSFMLNDTPAPNHIFILIDENYVIMESSGDDFSGAAPKSYFININTGKYTKTDYIFPDKYIVLPGVSYTAGNPDRG